MHAFLTHFTHTRTHTQPHSQTHTHAHTHTHTHTTEGSSQLPKCLKSKKETLLLYLILISSLLPSLQVMQYILMQLQSGAFCCLATVLPPYEVARAVSNQRQDFTSNHQYTVLGLADRIGFHQAIIVMENIHS